MISMQKKKPSQFTFILAINGYRHYTRKAV